MKWCIVVVLLLQVSWHSCSPVPEESVVSDYKNNNQSDGDVYHLIANNIAERITSPLYKLLGIETKNKTEATTKASSNIEWFDEKHDESKTDLKPSDNKLDERDVEELSVEALKKNDKKPEKITLYNSYLPSENIETLQNDTVNEIDDPFEFEDDDDDVSQPREGGLVYYLELIGSFFQLALGAVLALFKTSSGSS